MRRTGVPVIDSVIGGVGPGLPLVLAGPPGCGRTVLALELVAAALSERDIVAMLSSEPAPLLLQQASSLGHALTRSVVDEQLLLLEMDPVAPTNLAGAGGRALAEAIAEVHPMVSTVVIDPFTSLTADIMDEAPLRAIVRDLVAALPRASLVLCVETDRPELEAPVERVLSEVCGSYLTLSRDPDGQRVLRVEKTRAGVGRAEAVSFRISERGVELTAVKSRQGDTAPAAAPPDAPAVASVPPPAVEHRRPWLRPPSPSPRRRRPLPRRRRPSPRSLPPAP